MFQSERRHRATNRKATTSRSCGEQFDSFPKTLKVGEKIA